MEGQSGRCAKRWSVSRPPHTAAHSWPWLGVQLHSLSAPPGPYLTLVRSFRSVHLLDMSVQVIGPAEQRTKKEFKRRH
jgi:hypothetical protein